MPRKLITAILILAVQFAQAQFVFVGAPSEGFEQRIRTHIDTIRIVDTHEHLGPQTRGSSIEKLDFMLLLQQYADDDIKSAGLSKPGFAGLLGDSLSETEKWQILKPYWEKSINTTYNRLVNYTIQQLFGMDALSDRTVVPLSESIREAYQSDWYHTVISEKSNIAYVINDHPNRNSGNPKIFRYTKRFDYLQIDKRQKIEQLALQHSAAISSLEDLEQILRRDFDQALEEEFVTIKSTAAYYRTLYFRDVPREEAAKVFELIANSNNQPLPEQTTRILADYMMHRILDLALQHNKPIQIHTGLQAGDGNFIQHSNPALLSNLFLKYRDVKFLLMHGAYPYGGELAVLAKNFRNVYFDISWVYTISPSFTERYLHEWLETVPAGKIMGFGGDYDHVEHIYAHSLLAREILSRVLTDKVRSQYFTEEEAIKIASMVLFENAVEIFNLGQ